MLFIITLVLVLCFCAVFGCLGYITGNSTKHPELEPYIRLAGAVCVLGIVASILLNGGIVFGVTCVSWLCGLVLGRVRRHV